MTTKTNDHVLQTPSSLTNDFNQFIEDALAYTLAPEPFVFTNPILDALSHHDKLTDNDLVLIISSESKKLNRVIQIDKAYKAHQSGIIKEQKSDHTFFYFDEFFLKKNHCFRIAHSSSSAEDLALYKESEYDTFDFITKKISFSSSNLDESNIHLLSGCFHCSFSIPESELLSGTIRIESRSNTLLLSGDFYQQPMLDNFDEIPIYPIAKYHGYLRATHAELRDNNLVIDVEYYRYSQSSYQWTKTFSGVLNLNFLSSNEPQVDATLTLNNSAKNLHFSFQKISHYFRKATIEIDHDINSELPIDDGNGTDWKKVFDKAGWKITVITDSKITNIPEDHIWSDSELHDAMLKWRQATDFDQDWRYHLLCVRKLASTSRGIMYDAFAGDSNLIPREGAAIASHWFFPETLSCPKSTQKNWGACSGQRFGSCKSAYFRTALHEISHAMGLYHPSHSHGCHIMQATNAIACNAKEIAFPDNIDWFHSEEDAFRLVHLPDIWVRPGAYPFGHDYSIAPTPSHSDDTQLLDISLNAKASRYPLAAPVRVNWTLKNMSQESVFVPENLNMKGGYISGKVYQNDIEINSFCSLIGCLDHINHLTLLEPDEKITHDETLLYGRNGFLFPKPGRYKLELHFNFKNQQQHFHLTSSETIIVDAPVDEAHQSLAKRIMDSPELLLTFVLGSRNYLDESYISEILSNAVLSPHYQYLIAKQYTKKFYDMEPDYRKALAVISEQTIINSNELAKVLSWLKNI